MNIKEKIQDWLYLPDKVALARITYLEEEVNSLKRQIGEASMLAADVAFHKNDQTQIVIASKLGKGYVKIISVHYDDFHSLIEHVKSLEQQLKPKVRYYDAPPVAQAFLKSGPFSDD